MLTPGLTSGPTSAAALARIEAVWGDPDEVCGELGKAALLALRPPVFDDYALPLDIAEFA